MDSLKNENYLNKKFLSPPTKKFKLFKTRNITYVQKKENEKNDEGKEENKK